MMARRHQEGASTLQPTPSRDASASAASTGRSAPSSPRNRAQALAHASSAGRGQGSRASSTETGFKKRRRPTWALRRCNGEPELVDQAIELVERTKLDADLAYFF